MTEWKSLPSAPAYSVSSDGQIKGVYGKILRQNFHKKRRRASVCIHGRRRDVHLLVAETFLGATPEGLQVCHNDGDATNNRATNLRHDTSSANRLDSVKHGTHNLARRDSCAHGHKFTPENTRRTAKGRVCRKCDASRHRKMRSTS